MKHKHSLIAGAVLAACSMSSFAQEAVDPLKCAVAGTLTATQAEELVRHCAPAVTLFIGGASTMSAVTPAILTGQIFDTTLTGFAPIKIEDRSASATVNKGNVIAYVGRAKPTLDASVAGKLVYVVYNFNNGSAGGVSQLLGKVPKFADRNDPAKAINEAFVPFIGPAKDINTAAPTGKVASSFCGTTATTGVSIVSGSTTFGTVTSTATSVGCVSYSGQTADLALSDTRAQELYKVYAAAAKGKPSTLMQVPFFTQSFGVAVSPLLYSALQTAQGLTNDATAANQPSISSASYASLVSKGGNIANVNAFIAANAKVGITPATVTGQLLLARRDDLSGTQAVSNIFFVNGQCGGNERFDLLAAGDLKGVDTKIAKAGGLLGGLQIRQDVTDDTADLDVAAYATSTDVRNGLNNGGYAIGVAGVGSGGAQGTAGHFVKIDGFSPNADGTNFRSSTATRNQINAGYPFSHTLYGMYVTKTLDSTKAPFPAKKVLAQTVIEAFKNSSLSNISGIAYLDTASASAVASQQATFARANGNNCSPVVKR